MHRDQAFQTKFEKLLVIVLSWTAIGAVITVYDYLNVNSHLFGDVITTYKFVDSLILNCSVGFAAACLGGSFLVFVVNKRFRESPYWKTILFVAASFVVVSSLLIVLASFAIAGLQSGGPGASHSVHFFLTDSAHLKNLIIWAFVVILTQITLQISDKFGEGVLWNFITGKYHSPKAESRIFMFVDLNSSTAIAERLGSEKYHHFLRDYFADITDAIINNKGQIYQYVGDEVVISWRLDKNNFDSSSLHCFFDMCSIVMKRSNYYLSRYGYVPEFKAGLHYGQVIAGEVGIIKREITFSGDVLNTTSRIQGKCSEYGVTILSSDELLDHLPNDSFFKRKPVGEVELKGRESRIFLSTIESVG